MPQYLDEKLPTASLPVLWNGWIAVLSQILPTFLSTFLALPSLGKREVFFLDSGGKTAAGFQSDSIPGHTHGCNPGSES